MRKGIVVLVLVSLAGFSLFASGDKEEEVVPYGYGPRWSQEGPQGMADPRGNVGPRGYAGTYEEMPCLDEDFDFQELTLTGPVTFGVRGASLDVQGEEWNLLYPRQVLSGVELESGETISVTGVTVPALRYQEDPEEGNYLMVQSAEIRGETYDLGASRGGYGGQPRGGMMGAQGRGGFMPRGGGRRW